MQLQMANSDLSTNPSSSVLDTHVAANKIQYEKLFISSWNSLKKLIGSFFRWALQFETPIQADRLRGGVGKAS